MFYDSIVGGWLHSHRLQEEALEELAAVLNQVLPAGLVFGKALRELTGGTGAVLHDPKCYRLG